ncbi:hypothetical protein MHB40_20430 [Lysinibacillus sp. FSL K6-0057]|uniref:hypothetical protein n=1 Tax=Lysinibacillus sp. FSL K6-0057 TaxID=2921411 RepID=UPI00315A42D4
MQDLLIIFIVFLLLLISFVLVYKFSKSQKLKEIAFNVVVDTASDTLQELLKVVKERIDEKTSDQEKVDVDKVLAEISVEYRQRLVKAGLDKELIEQLFLDLINKSIESE